MSTLVAPERPMAKERKNMPVRITDEAIRWARIASGYTGESMAEYVSRIVVERSKEDADRLHVEAIKGPAKETKPTKGRGSKE